MKVKSFRNTMQGFDPVKEPDRDFYRTAWRQGFISYYRMQEYIAELDEIEEEEEEEDEEMVDTYTIVANHKTEDGGFRKVFYNFYGTDPAEYFETIRRIEDDGTLIGLDILEGGGE